MLKPLVSTVVFAAFATGAAVADERVVVVELYTSQGCSSCPPADALLSELADRDDVIALALHVDYWDYIGWKDEFANPAHTTRQKGYAYAAGQRTIYTPQMIVGGQDHVVGYKPMKLAKYIEMQSDRDEVVEIDLVRDGENLQIEIPASSGIGGAEIVLIRYQPKATVDVRRGENAGRRLTYSNIVTEMVDLGDWNGAEPWSQSLALEGDLPVVVMVQRQEYGPILSAARLR